MATRTSENATLVGGARSLQTAGAAHQGEGSLGDAASGVRQHRAEPGSVPGVARTPRALRPRDLAVRVALALVLTLLLVPLVALVLPRVSYHRLMGRVFLICVLATWLPAIGSPRTWGEGLCGLGLCGPDRLRRVTVGAALSMLVFSGALAVSWALGGRQALGGVAPGWPLHLVQAAIAGISVGLLEEVIWRGYLRGVLGAVTSSLLYAAAHYFRPLGLTTPAGGAYDPWIAVRRFPEMVQAWSEPRHATLGMLSLFLFGMALCHLRRRTGSLWPSIGVHFGAVVAIEMYRDIIDPAAIGSLWIHGGTRLHDGVLGTLGVALLFWMVTRWKVARDADDGVVQVRA